MDFDPLVKYNLQAHLIYSYHRDQSSPIILGSTEQLETTMKIMKSDAINKCFGFMNEIRDYPILPKNQYLVACVDRFIDIQVIAIYTLNQWKAIQQLKSSPMVVKMDWRVLEIPEDVEKFLLKGVSIEDSIIISSHKDALRFKLSSKL